MAKAMPSIQEAAKSAPVNNTTDVSSLFSMLLSSMMQGFESNAADTNTAAQSNAGNASFAPADQSAIPLQVQKMIHKDVPVSANDTSNLKFKPVQFVKLENMLGGKLSGTATHFIEAGKKYDIDPNLLSAIAIHETGNGKSRAVNEKLNVAGMMGKNGLRSYDSLSDSIFDMARNLRQNYLNQGKTTIAAIGAKYAPVGASNDPTGLNNHWTTGVAKQLNRLS